MVLAADPVAGWASAAMAGRAPAPAATVAPGRGEVAHPTPGRHRRAGSARNHPSELHHAALRGRPVPHRRPRVREAGRLSRPTRLLPGEVRTVLEYDFGGGLAGVGRFFAEADVPCRPSPGRPTCSANSSAGSRWS